jgi:hypothetical protein
MTLYFLHPDNINILWNAICKHPLTQNFQSRQEQQQWFQNCLNDMQNRISQDCLYGYNRKGIQKEILNKLNQETILYMVNDLKSKYMQQSKKSDLTQRIQQDFLEKQREFESLMQPNKPSVTNLPIEDKDEPIKNMDDLIKQQIQSRELDIAPQPSVSLGIRSYDEIPGTKNILISEEPTTISVSEIPSQLTIKKHVTFPDTDTDALNRITLLEKELQELKVLVSKFHDILLQSSTTEATTWEGQNHKNTEDDTVGRCSNASESKMGLLDVS